jgi:hypothetical protein
MTPSNPIHISFFNYVYLNKTVPSTVLFTYPDVSYWHPQLFIWKTIKSLKD